MYSNYIVSPGKSTTPQVSAAISGHTSTSASTTGGKGIGTLHYITYYTHQVMVPVHHKTALLLTKLYSNQP